MNDQDISFDDYFDNLKEGDLKTPQDVLLWLETPVSLLLKEYRNFGYDDGEERYISLDKMLSRRLCEEKRIACGKIALKYWKLMKGEYLFYEKERIAEFRAKFDKFRLAAKREET